MIALLIAAVAGPSLSVTINEVRANPSHYDGKRVRLTGWVNSCRSLDCGLTENLAARPINRGDWLSFEGDETFDGAVAPLLPARIEIEATFNADCFTRSICLDRAPVLQNVTILNVLLRKQEFPDK